LLATLATAQGLSTGDNPDHFEDIAFVHQTFTPFFAMQGGPVVLHKHRLQRNPKPAENFLNRPPPTHFTRITVDLNVHGAKFSPAISKAIPTAINKAYRLDVWRCKVIGT
jgi:hypothetical protein